VVPALVLCSKFYYKKVAISIKFITDDPLTTVVLGAGKMLDNLDLLKKMSLE